MLFRSSGVQHSEANHAPSSTTHFFQIWLLPNAQGIAPGYEQKHFKPEDKRGRLRLVASTDGRDGSVRLNADAALYAGLFDGAEAATVALNPQRKTYVHLVRGSLNVNGHALTGGDAALMSQESLLTLTDAKDAEVIVFDLAA